MNVFNLLEPKIYEGGDLFYSIPHGKVNEAISKCIFFLLFNEILVPKKSEKKRVAIRIFIDCLKANQNFSCVDGSHSKVNSKPNSTPLCSMSHSYENNLMSTVSSPPLVMGRRGPSVGRALALSHGCGSQDLH